MEHIMEKNVCATVGTLQVQLSAHTVLWSINNSWTLWSENVHFRSPAFRVPLVADCLFTLSFASQIPGLIVQINKINNNVCLPKSAQLCIDIKISLVNLSGKCLCTKSGILVDTTSVSFSFEHKEVEAVRNRAAFGIQCCMTIDASKQINQTFSLCKKRNVREPKAAISLNELKEHLMVMLDDEADRILIKVEGENFPVHQNLLSLHSPVFAAMFQHDTLENTQKCIHINDSSKDIIGEMLKYIYTGKTSALSVDIAMELYTLADKYSIVQLKTQCSNFLASSLAEEHVFDVIILADRCGDEKLTNISISFLIENSYNILQTEDFLLFLKSESETARKVFFYLMKQIVK